MGSGFHLAISVGCKGADQLYWGGWDGAGRPHPEAVGLTGTVPETPRVPTAAQLPPLTAQDSHNRLSSKGGQLSCLPYTSA